MEHQDNAVEICPDQQLHASLTAERMSSNLQTDPHVDSSGLECLPDAVFQSIHRFISPAMYRPTFRPRRIVVASAHIPLRCVSRRCLSLVTASQGDVRTSLSSQWGLAITTASRRILRACRSCTCWLVLELVAFPLLLLLRMVGVEISDFLVFLPTWLALLMSLRTAWTSSRAREAVGRAMALRSQNRRRRREPSIGSTLLSQRPLLNVDLRTVNETRTLNLLHVAASLPFPLVHVSLLAHWFVQGCLLSIVPSLVLAIAATWSVLSQRCKLQAICGMLSSVAIILEWCYFPACILPTTLRVPVYKMFFWLLPVTMPYILLACCAFEARTYSIVVAVVFVYASVICLHLAFVGAGPVSSSMSCALLSAAGCLLARYTWQQSQQGVLDHSRLEQIFAAFSNLLQE